MPARPNELGSKRFERVIDRIDDAIHEADLDADHVMVEIPPDTAEIVADAYRSEGWKVEIVGPPKAYNRRIILRKPVLPPDRTEP